MTRVSLTVNGAEVTHTVEPRTSLADFLRDDLDLTGTHIGCEHGICGACTIEIDGQIARSCITLAVACDGAEIRTIEAFDDDPLMAELRQAFSSEHALQCGYCTPGMLIAARDLVRRGKAGSAAEIRTAMSGNLCRCTGYMGIVQAIANVAGDKSAPHAGNGKAAILGPAPGPGAPDSLALADAAPEAPIAPTARAASQHPAAASSPPSDDRVKTGAIGQDGKFTTLTQTITVDHPRSAVWSFMADLEKVAACMPGATLDGPPKDDHVSGRIAVKLGPIGAEFAGDADVTRFEDEWRGLIDGRGRDSRSASRARGRVAYQLAEANDGRGTEIEVSIAYALAGPLAQFSRGAMVRDLVGRLAGAFAQNLEARLSGRGDTVASPAKLDAGSLVFSIVWDRVKAFLRRLFG